MATVDDARELLRDPSNLTELGDPAAGLAVKKETVVRLLRARGAQSEREALALIRRAARELGGDEVIVARRGALSIDRLGSEPEGFEVAFWVPRQRQPRASSAPPPPVRRRRRWGRKS